MRQCPTLDSDERPLIAHSIASEVCMKRQREFYHKCHRCLFRGKAADYVQPIAEGDAVSEAAAAQDVADA